MKEIVIKIPEDEYNIAKYGQYGNINVDIVRKAIANGIPLPKGHGRLIDADDVKKKIELFRDGHNYYGNEYESACYQSYDMAVDEIDDAPTIIEADKESKE